MSCSVRQITVGQPFEILSRIIGWNGNPIVPDDFDLISYSAFILRTATGEEVPVDGYQDIPLTPIEDHVNATLVDDVKWEKDDIGYNFHFMVPGAIFTEPNQTYGIRVTFELVETSPDLVALFLVEVDND